MVETGGNYTQLDIAFQCIEATDDVEYMLIQQRKRGTSRKRWCHRPFTSALAAKQSRQ